MSEVPPAVEPVSTPDAVAAPATAAFGLQPNVAAAISYVFGWVTGLIFFLVEKDNSLVRFHAMQSILLSLALMALWFLMGIVAVATLGLGVVLFPLLAIAILALVIYLIIQAAQSKVYKLPVIGDMAAKQAGL